MLTAEIEQLAPIKPANDKDQKRQSKPVALPALLPRKDVHHEPDSSSCHCSCHLHRIGEDVAEKLDCQPGAFTVERHVRCKWVCRECETLVQAPVPPQIIDKGIPTAALLAQVLVPIVLDQLRWYRQSGIYGRSGFAIPDTTLAQWVGVYGVRLQPLVDALAEQLLAQPVLHADETPVAMLKPGLGKTHRAYLWSYCSTSMSSMKAVVFDFAESRAGRHAGEFLEDWQGTLVCDDFAGYKALFRQSIMEAGGMAQARRKFHELYANHKNQNVEEALKLFGVLYDVERQVQEVNCEARKML
ncbi:IS66 family transposase [Noviherbaspirillum sp. 17J57-3]|uniref:IS66 family transposase n=1 Tax=Noviherbaspirillum galbum TaxID=2709383 RepID=A0A6B3SW62_9BURK|nr:IS66 family transposase [Noviherbaspirillum galbum]